MGPQLTATPMDAEARAVAVEMLRLAQTRHWDEALFVMALAEALGHVAATLDLQQDVRTFPDRMHTFTAWVEQTYRRSLQRAPRSPAPFRG